MINKTNPEVIVYFVFRSEAFAVGELPLACKVRVYTQYAGCLLSMLGIVHKNIFTYKNGEKCFNNLIETIKFNHRIFYDRLALCTISVHLYICTRDPILIAIRNM